MCMISAWLTQGFGWNHTICCSLRRLLLQFTWRSGSGQRLTCINIVLLICFCRWIKGTTVLGWSAPSRPPSRSSTPGAPWVWWATSSFINWCHQEDTIILIPPVESAADAFFFLRVCFFVWYPTTLSSAPSMYIEGDRASEAAAGQEFTLGEMHAVIDLGLISNNKWFHFCLNLKK